MIGPYKLRNCLATGQSSQVWEVIEPKSGRHFAMKLLLPEATRDAEQKHLLHHEAKVGTSLATPKPHDNIIHIVAVSKATDPKNQYFVMEFFPAGSMKARVMNKQVDFIKEHSQSIFQQIAKALAFAHGCGWVHRDMKPDNILADSIGKAKLIDFGIACKIEKPGFFGKLFRSKGKIQGTRSYMSPEQIRCEPLDGRADIYSYAATWYEIVTTTASAIGRPPFRGANSQDLLNKHLHEKALPPKSLNPEITDDFNDLLVRMLAKKREDRPLNFHEILMAYKTIRVFKSASPPKGPKAG
jgi:serine/threonine-protein kinase